MNELSTKQNVERGQVQLVQDDVLPPTSGQGAVHHILILLLLLIVGALVQVLLKYYLRKVPIFYKPTLPGASCKDLQVCKAGSQWTRTEWQYHRRDIHEEACPLAYHTAVTLQKIDI